MKKTRFIPILMLLIVIAAVFSFNAFAASKVTVSLSTTSYTYSGKANTPTVTVKNAAGTKLTKNTDYTVSYASGRKNVGSYSVKITLKGKYSGTVSKTFTVVPKGTSITKLTPSTTTVKVTAKEQKTQTTGYQVQYSLKSSFSSAKTKASKTTTITPSALQLYKTYYFRVRTYKTVDGKNYYSTWSAAKSINTKLPTYKSSPYVSLNSNKPYFTSSQLTKKSYEKYSSLDSLGRCGVAIASVGTNIMPTEARGEIGSVKPTGWHTVKYDCVSGKYLYNRCHLIAFELAGENANEKNLITGTRYMNIDGMLPFENMVHDYVKETGNHVMYRVTPIFKGSNLVASGVQIEGYSVEDKGDGICFNVYCFNVQPGVTINYADGSSALAGSDSSSSTTTTTTTTTSSSASTSKTVYVTASGTKYHALGCRYLTGTYSAISLTDANAKGYTACSVCKP